MDIFKFIIFMTILLSTVYFLLKIFLDRKFLININQKIDNALNFINIKTNIK
ncbi:hypothetical protein [Poseidonibacter ostreae]|uniref:hypothetical protein n=1 Tax=Poseidonibacter ostreae TaxID=2654171 RepID=UPI00186B0A3C|nr:hypothetical protein [Poseidonibacter ostreae]